MFKKSFVLLAAGTWQDLSTPKSLGFNSTLPEFDLAKTQNSIPAELLNRASHPPFFLSETSGDEFRQAVERIHSELNTHPDVPVDLLVQKALGSGLNFRWLQNYVASLLRTQDPELKLRIY